MDNNAFKPSKKQIEYVKRGRFISKDSNAKP